MIITIRGRRKRKMMMVDSAGAMIILLVLGIIVTPSSVASATPPFFNSVSTTSGTTATTNTSTLLYDNPYSGIQIRYPKDWAYIESGNFLTGEPVLGVIFMPAMDALQIGTMLQQDPTKAATTTTEMQPSTMVMVVTFQLPFGNMDVRLFMDYLMTQEGDYQIISTNPNAVLSGLPAYEAVALSLEPEENRTKWLLLTAIQGERAYNVAYASQESTFDQFLPIARDMISSFTITP